MVVSNGVSQWPTKEGLDRVDRYNIFTMLTGTIVAADADYG